LCNEEKKEQTTNALAELSYNDKSFLKLLLIANGGKRARRIADSLKLTRITAAKPAKKKKREDKTVRPYKTKPDYPPVNR
jgi:hypothetical protein